MTQLNALSAKTLALLVDPAHLQSAAIAAARLRFGEGDNRHLVIDDFLVPHLLPLLRAMIDEEGEFEDNLKLAKLSRADKPSGQLGPHGKVDADTFLAAPSEDRFICQRRLIGPKAGFEDSAASKAERFVRTMLASAPMHEWLTAITGLSVAATGGINLKLHGPGHFLKPHSDAREGRQLCAVFYLHETWQRSYDGRFVLQLADGGIERIDPLPNRMILFDVTQQNVHAIEPLGKVPAGWWRSNYSVWFA